MAEIAPFRGLRYDESVAGALGDLICPPYDVISEEERERLYARSERNFVRIEYARRGPHSDPYVTARDHLERWLGEGALRYDPSPAFYVYDHHFEAGGRSLRRRGFIAALRLYEQPGVVLPHERTIPKDKTDRLTLLRTTRLNTSPVFGMFEDAQGRVAEILEERIRGGPDAVADAQAGRERHVVWALDDRVMVERIKSALAGARIYLADGHHRYEVALEHLAESGSSGGKRHDPPAYVLAYLCALEDPGLMIFPTHRVISGAAAPVEEAIARSFDAHVVDRGAVGDVQPGIVVARGGGFRRLEPRPDLDLSRVPEAIRAVPVAQAEALIVERARAAGGQVSYEHDIERAVSAAEAGATALLLRGVDPATLRLVADAGERFPPKTTYFYPKVPAGLVARRIA